MTLSEVRVTVLIENTAARSDLATEHGFSAWVDTGESKVLFDTGASGRVVRNAEVLGVDLAAADAIVLSHRHADHTGGLEAAAAQASRATVYAHPAAGIVLHTNPVLTSRKSEAVVPGVLTTGEIARTTDVEAEGGYAHMPDDQALFFEVPEGVVVVVGCAHAGVVNTLRHVAQLTRSEKIYAVLGGMHLPQASEERLAKTVEAFRELGLRRIGPCHCTGDRAIRRFESEFPAEFFRCQTGSVLTFGAAGD